MLPAQVSYWNLVETNRHNAVMEKLGYDQNKINERNVRVSEYNAMTNRYNALESHRHNAATELNYGYQLAETSRHNAAMEGIQGQANVLGYYNYLETQRRNETEAYKAETDRLRYQLDSDINSAKATTGGWTSVLSEGSKTLGNMIGALDGVVRIAKAIF